MLQSIMLLMEKIFNLGSSFGANYVMNLIPGGTAVNKARKGAKLGKVAVKNLPSALSKRVKSKASKGMINTAEQLSRQSVDEKLARYLLNLEHPVGGSKAKWFRNALGFTQENADVLARQIVFNQNKAVQTAVTEYGIKFNQIISIKGANGKIIDVTFGWIKNNDGIVRLVTGIPTKM